ncbi:hypothetical protein BJX66DRAFT_182585 [Aspergillus keveii]|uniref:Transmembrane protein n=1 Tax=Aspergillus keveii TaxID=714993 RepID=A0ABR4GNU1_9EURO
MMKSQLRSVCDRPVWSSYRELTQVRAIMQDSGAENERTPDSSIPLNQHARRPWFALKPRKFGIQSMAHGGVLKDHNSGSNETSPKSETSVFFSECQLQSFLLFSRFLLLFLPSFTLLASSSALPFCLFRFFSFARVPFPL